MVLMYGVVIGDGDSEVVLVGAFEQLGEQIAGPGGTVLGDDRVQ
jgi:hypothetical protein